MRLLTCESRDAGTQTNKQTNKQTGRGRQTVKVILNIYVIVLFSRGLLLTDDSAMGS